MLKAFNEWCLGIYGKKPFEECMDFAKNSEAPPLDFVFHLTSLLDGYTTYLVHHVKEKED